MPRGRKASKRPRVDDPEQDASQPMAKRTNQMDITDPQLDHGNDPSTLALQLSDEACLRQVEAWQRAGGFELDMDMYVPGVCGTDEIPASDNPYCKVNKVLFEVHAQWLQRQPADFSP